MSDISFEEDSDINQRPRDQHSKGLTERLIGWGIVKNESSANLILLCFVILGIFITVFFLKQSFSSGNSYGNYDSMRNVRPELFKNNPPPTR